MSQHRNEDPVGLLRVDRDSRDLLTVAQPEVSPRLAGVNRLIETVSGREIGTLQSFARADVDHARIARRDFHRADAPRRLLVEDRIPGASGIGGLPDAAVGRADVERVRLARHAGCRLRATGAEGTDVTPLRTLDRTGREGPLRAQSGGDGKAADQRECRGEESRVEQGPNAGHGRFFSEGGGISSISRSAPACPAARLYAVASGALACSGPIAGRLRFPQCDPRTVGCDIRNSRLA